MQNEKNPVRDFVIFWNNTFILDYWYRQKYKIAFNSEQHRNVEPIDIMVEWEEEQIGTIIRNRQVEDRLAKDYQKTGSWLIPRKQEVPDGFYDNIDWDKFDSK